MEEELKVATPIQQQLIRVVPVVFVSIGVGFLGVAVFFIVKQLALPTTPTASPVTTAPAFRTANRNLFPDRTSPTGTGEILVKFKSSRLSLRSTTADAKVDTFAVANGLDPVATAPAENIVAFRVKGLSTAASKITALRTRAEVAEVQPNFQYTVLTNDSLYAQQWALHNTGQAVGGSTGTVGADIKAPDAWAAAGTLPNVLVADIDTGAAYTHADLANRMWDGSGCVDENSVVLGGCIHGYDFEDNDLDPRPTWSEHGTLTAGVIAAEENNGAGIAGVAPNARIMALKTGLTTLEIIRAIHFAQANGAKIINASWGGSQYDTLMADAITTYNGLFVAAAGNWGGDHGQSYNALYPCDYTAANILCVTASDQNDQRPYWADYGATSVDLAAPGASIVSDSVNTSDNYEDFNGATIPGLPAGYIGTGTFGTRASIFSSSSLYGDATNVPYLPNANATATSPVLNLNGASGAFVDFFTGCDTEYTTSWDDYLALEVQNLPTYTAPAFTRTWGSSGSGNTQFNRPGGAAFDASGNMYIVDTLNSRIKKFNSTGTFVTSWGGNGSGNGQFSNPKNIAIDPSGIIYVHDFSNNRIQKFAADGSYLTQWSTYGQVKGMTVDALGYVYEVDYPHLKINRYSPTGALLSDWDPSSDISGADQIAVDTSGNVYLTYPSTGLIRAFDADGYLLQQWGGIGTDNGHFQTISSIAVDAQKHVYVLDATGKIQLFASDGTWLASWGTSGAGNGQFSTPGAIAAGGMNVLVADTYNNRVQEFAAALPTTTPGFSELKRWNEK